MVALKILALFDFLLWTIIQFNHLVSELSLMAIPQYYATNVVISYLLHDIT